MTQIMEKEDRRMPGYAKECRGTVITGMRYRNALKMIDWLVEAFGFEKQAVYADGETVMHAQLTFGNGMVMLGSVNPKSPAAPWMTQPDEVGGKETQAPYLVVKDIEGLYARAKKAGAKMVMELETKDYGGSGFTCLDPEGHVWHVGTYDPWEGEKG
jgi:uncharacterized glyoxalase superfamily protein PhnB